MRTVARESLKIATCFAVWCAIVAVRAAVTRPYELLWFTGIVAAFLFAATCGYIWRGLKPRRDDWRARRRG
ncbi:hypothetical protein ACQ856_18055 [Mycolicibacterium psychrotolerans]|uniref:hypothetical protein n=1 Tax=Mycolicibacterium psychrotolerans TaxID=216929 RepID=UPI003D676266